MARGKRTLAFAALLAIHGVASSADDPYVVLSVKSIDELTRDSKRLVPGDKAGPGSPVDAFLAMTTGGKGLEGLDRTKPLGACLDLSPTGTPEGILLLPVKDAAAFLQLLGIPADAAKSAEGRTFHVAVFGRELYTKLSKGYAYFSAAAAQLDRLPGPSCLSSRHDVGLVISFGKLTPAQRQLMADTLASQLEATRSMTSQARGRSGSYGRGYELGSRMTASNIARVILEADRFTLGINLDASSGIFAVDWDVTARPGTSLAGTFNSYGSKSPSFGGLFSNDAAASLAWTAPIPEEVRESFAAEMAMSAQQAHAEVDGSRAYATPSERQYAHEGMDSFFKAFEGLSTFDAACILDPAPSGKPQLVAAFRVASGREVSTTFEKLSKLPASALDDVEMKLDAVQHPRARIHSMKLPQLSEVLAGDTLFVGVRGDAVFLAVGPNGASLVKSALDKTNGAPPNRPPVSMRFRPSRLIGLFAAGKSEPWIDRARKAFASGGDYATFEVLTQRDGLKGRLTLGEGFSKCIQQGFAGAPGAR